MIHKSLLRLSILALLASLTMAACAPRSTPTPTPEPTPLPITLTDGLGRTVTLKSPAGRVVSLAASNTEILYALGADSQLVGRDEFSDYPEQAKSLPSVGGSFGGYNNEAILALKPDLVLAAEINTPEQVQAIQDLGLNVYLLPNPKDMEGLYQNLLTLAQLTGHEPKARILIESLKSRVAAVKEKVATAAVTPVVFYELDSTDPNAPYTAGPGNFISTLVEMAGGQNIGSVLSSAWAQISAEELIVKNPQIIILGDSAYGVTPESVKQRAGWETIQAVKDGKIYPFDDNLVSRPGPRLVDSLEELAKLLHPELF